MQFQVPQFIEVEDKIFGPLTFKQFVYLAGGVGMGYVLWRILPIYIAAPLIAGAIGLGAGLAFFKYNGQPFILALEHGFFFYVRSKLYLWSNDLRTDAKKKEVSEQTAPLGGEVYVPKLSDSRLHELAWSLDIKERIAAGTAHNEDHPSPLQGLIAPVHTARDALIQ